MISYLQEVPFAINEEVFKIIEDSMHELVYAGLLMPPFLAQVKPKLVRQALKNELNSDRFKGKFRYSYMYRVIVKRIQRARYEQGLLALARAYVGYDIYFPAFTYLLRGKSERMKTDLDPLKAQEVCLLSFFSTHLITSCWNGPRKDYARKIILTANFPSSEQINVVFSPTNHW